MVTLLAQGVLWGHRSDIIIKKIIMIWVTAKINCVCRMLFNCFLNFASASGVMELSSLPVHQSIPVRCHL
jgi:hypothetical protein